MAYHPCVKHETCCSPFLAGTGALLWPFTKHDPCFTHKEAVRSDLLLQGVPFLKH